MIIIITIIFIIIIMEIIIFTITNNLFHFSASILHDYLPKTKIHGS